MKKPLTFCLLTTVGLIVIGALDNVRILTLNADTYAFAQVLLAALSASGALCHAGQRHRQSTRCVGPLIFGIMAGALSAVLATKNPGLGTQFCGTGGCALYVALAAMSVDALFCLLHYVELDSARQLTGQKEPRAL